MGALGIGGGTGSGVLSPEKAATLAAILGGTYGLSKVPVRASAAAVVTGGRALGNVLPQGVKHPAVGRSGLFFGQPQGEQQN